MRDLTARLKEIWESTSQTNRILLAACVLGVVLVGGGFMFWAGSPEYTVLVQNPSPGDLQGILNHLRDKKVEYRVSSDGKSIEVPAAKRPELQMSLAAMGLMNSGTPGAEMLRQTSTFSTKRMEDESLRRALQADVEASIQTLGPVQSANVKFAPGDDSPFVSEKRAPSAAVLVHLRTGQTLDKSNIRSIVTLVAHSYPGLDDKGISVVDGEGNLLWDGAQHRSDLPGTEDRQAQERAFKESLGRELQAMIARVVGPNKSAVVVRTVLNLDSRKQDSRVVEAGAPKRKETRNEKFSGGAAVAAARNASPGLAGNAAGAPAGVPVYQGTDPAAGGNGGTYTNENGVSEMDNGFTVTSTQSAPGEVKNLSVAVMLDKSVTPETVAAIRRNIETVAKTYLPDPAAVPLVSVESVEFDKTAQQAEAKAAEAAAAADRTNRMLGFGVPVALMLAMLLILAKNLRKAFPTELPALAGGPKAALAGAGSAGSVAALAPGVGGNLDISVGEDSIIGQPVGEALQKHAGPIPVELDDDDPRTFEVIQEAFDANLESITHLASSKPEIVAALVRSWIAEGK
jgi:flagellar M-ring protein FliF